MTEDLEVTPPGEILSGCAARAEIQRGKKSLPPGAAKTSAHFAHAMYHVLDDHGCENAQAGVFTLEIPADEWKSLNDILDRLGDDPHEVLHDLIGVNDE